MFVGETLTNIRLLHGLSRSELALQLNLTEQSIWQYENGYISPSLEIINKMRDYFQVRPTYFYSPNYLENEINEQQIAYRSTVRNSRLKTKSETVYLEFINHITNYLSSAITYPTNRLKKIKNEVINFKNKNSGKMDNQKMVEQIAAHTRASLGLEKENNDNLLFYMEKSGAFIFEKNFGETVDACSTWSSTDIPYIILGNIKKSAVRRNFDLAHELGHLLMHYKIDITDLDKKEYDQIEKEANLFAANFLLPKEEFLSDLQSVRKISNPNAYIELKEKWKVSIATMAHRAYSLEQMTYQQYRYFNASLNRNNYKVKEPLDEEITIMKPGKVRSSFKAIFENEIRSVEDILAYTKFELNLLANLLNIELEFFEQFMKKNRGSQVLEFDFVLGER